MWLKQLSYDPLSPLWKSHNPAIEYFARRDLLGEEVGEIKVLWDLPIPRSLIRRQQDDGSWKYPGGNKKIRSPENYNQLETFRNFGELVEKFGFDNSHPTIQNGAEYLFTCQTDEGDFRGIYGNQYATTYSAAIMELLIKAGYADDPRIEHGFHWLLSQRQDDGGWAIPLRTMHITYKDALKLPQVLQGDRSKPFSHLITGMALRAFAAHPDYRNIPEAQHAAELLMSRFFQRDKYVDRQDKKYWEGVSFPFWFTDILTSLDSLYFLGFRRDQAPIQTALDWLSQRQLEDGTFNLKILRGRDKDLPYWITLVASRIFKRYYADLK